MRRWRLSQAARELRPLRQGELDGLCGLYAIINAIRLSVHPHRLRKAEVRSLFESGLKVLTKTRRLRYIIAGGMDDPVWERMVEAVLNCAAVDLGHSLRLDDLLRRPKVRSTVAAHKGIRRALHAGLPTIITLNRSYDHWTVLCAYTKSRYQLFDSWGYRWVRTANVVLDETGEEATHGLARALALRSEP